MAIDPLPVYNPDAACSKCGRTPVGTRECATNTPSVGLYGPFHWPMWVHVIGSHLHRKCGRCDHEWIELALDARMMTAEEAAKQRADWQEGEERFRAIMHTRYERAPEPESKRRWPWLSTPKRGADAKGESA